MSILSFSLILLMQVNSLIDKLSKKNDYRHVPLSKEEQKLSTLPRLDEHIKRWCEVQLKSSREALFQTQELIKKLESNSPPTEQQLRLLKFFRDEERDLKRQIVELEAGRLVKP